MQQQAPTTKTSQQQDTAADSVTITLITDHATTNTTLKPKPLDYFTNRKELLKDMTNLSSTSPPQDSSCTPSPPMLDQHHAEFERASCKMPHPDCYGTPMKSEIIQDTNSYLGKRIFFFAFCFWGFLIFIFQRSVTLPVEL